VSYGIFIIPASNFATCFPTYTIGYNLGNSGYANTYYDVENANGNLYTFTYQVPSSATAAQLTPIYFTAATYPSGVVPSTCMTGNYGVPLV
jgi:hypothetical protein